MTGYDRNGAERARIAVDRRPGVGGIGVRSRAVGPS